jgi:hypothetical protein
MKASAKISKCKENFLKIDMWNIKGLTTEKVNDPHFQNIISKFNITSFVETWIGESTQDIVLPNFELVHSSSRKKHKKARRYSGGISILQKNQLLKESNR